MFLFLYRLCLTGKAPWVEVTTSSYAEDWLKVLQDPNFYDVIFRVEGRQLKAHKMVLRSASTFFDKVFGALSEVVSIQFNSI